MRFVLVMILIALTASSAASLKAVSYPQYTALFERTGGWNGGDGGYSVKLDENRTAWLFSDSFVGPVIDGKRDDNRMINNCVAIQYGSLKDCRLKFYYPERMQKPNSFFVPEDKDSWFWLYDGVVTKEGLFVFLMHIVKTDDSVFGFSQVDSWIAHVKNYDESPYKWKYTLHRIPYSYANGAVGVFYGSCLLHENGKTFIYGVFEDRKTAAKAMILAGTDSENITDFASWKFYDGNGFVSDSERAAILSENVPNEYRVHYNARMDKYMLSYSEAGFSDKIMLCTSNRRVGPWSKPQIIYVCPEHVDGRIFAYSAKAQPAVSTDSDIFITYFTNAFDFWTLADAKLYRPIFIRLPVRK